MIYANSSEPCLLIFFACTSVVVSWVTNHRSHRILDWTIFCMSAILYFFLFNVISFCSDTCFLLVEYLLQNETSSSCSLLSLMEERKQRRNKCFYGSGCLLWCGKTVLWFKMKKPRQVFRASGRLFWERQSALSALVEYLLQHYIKNAKHDICC